MQCICDTSPQNKTILFFWCPVMMFAFCISCWKPERMLDTVVRPLRLSSVMTSRLPGASENSIWQSCQQGCLPLGAGCHRKTWLEMRSTNQCLNSSVLGPYICVACVWTVGVFSDAKHAVWEKKPNAKFLPDDRNCMLSAKRQAASSHEARQTSQFHVIIQQNKLLLRMIHPFQRRKNNQFHFWGQRS